MPEEWVDLRDLMGPYAGRVRPYLKHAAENAVASGFAEYVRPREGTGAEGPAAVPPPEVEPGPLPEDFPAREQLLEAGIGTLGAVPRSAEELTAIEGIGQGFARRILAALEGEEG